MAPLGRLSPFLAMLTLSGDKPKGSQDLSNWKTADPNSPAFAAYWDEVAKTKGWDRGGQRSRGRGRDRGDIERERSLDAFTTNSVSVDGRPINKSNPMPVEIAGAASPDSGWGWLGKVGSAIGSLFSGLSSGRAGETPGGTVGAMAGGSGPGKGAAAVPDIPGMTRTEKNQLGLILKYESHGRNVMNYQGQAQNIDPTTAKGYTAQGYFQILNSNWRRLAPKLGITAKNAMAASLEDQTKVALALMRESGIGNWSNFNPSLKRALQRGEDAGPWAGRIPTTKLPTIAAGAAASAKLSGIANDNRVTTSSTSAETHISTININAPNATDADGIAEGITDSLRRNGAATASNCGPR